MPDSTKDGDLRRASTQSRLSERIETLIQQRFRSVVSTNKGLAGGPWDPWNLSAKKCSSKTADNNNEPEGVLPITSYSALVLVPREDICSVQLTLLLDGIRTDVSDRLEARIGDVAQFSMRREGPLISGQCPLEGIDKYPSTLSLRLSEVTEAGVRSLLYRMTHNECAQGPIIDALPVTFVKDGGGVRKHPLLHGPQASEIERRLRDGRSAAVTPYCTELETESLAAWSVLRMMETQQAPLEGRGVCLHTNFRTDRQEPTCQSSEAGEEAILVPSCLKKMLNDQRNTRPDFPLTYSEFRSRLESLRAHALGHMKSALSTNTALYGMTNPLEAGVIPAALKSALYLSFEARTSQLIEHYHSQVLTFQPLSSRSVHLFCKHRPSDAVITIFTLTLRKDVARLVPVLERFSAEETRMSEPKYWNFVDDVPPKKNRTAVLMCEDLERLKSCPLPDNLKTGDVPPVMDTSGVEIAPACFLYVENWPRVLRSAYGPSKDM